MLVESWSLGNPFMDNLPLTTSWNPWNPFWVICLFKLLLGILGPLGILSWIICPLLVLADGAALRSIASSKKNFQWKTTSLPIETISQKDISNCRQLIFHWNWFLFSRHSFLSREEWREGQVLCQSVDVFRKTIVVHPVIGNGYTTRPDKDKDTNI